MDTGGEERGSQVLKYVSGRESRDTEYRQMIVDIAGGIVIEGRGRTRSWDYQYSNFCPRNSNSSVIVTTVQFSIKRTER